MRVLFFLELGGDDKPPPGWWHLLLILILIGVVALVAWVRVAGG